jgi:PAS domain S-box-containing protein
VAISPAVGARAPRRQSPKRRRSTAQASDPPQAAEAIERGSAEQALRGGDERFRRYFELGLIGMACTSPSKGIVEVNDELCRILGYTREELLQKTWAEMTHPDDLAADVAQFERVMAGEIDGYSLEKRWVRKDGEIIHSVMSARCQRRTDRSIDYFVGLVLDVTERKRAEKEARQAEEKLAESNRRFRLLAETLPQQVWSYDRNGSANYLNQHWLDYTGMTWEEARGNGGHAVVHPNDRPALDALRRQVSAEKKSFESEVRLRKKSGEYRRFLIQGAPFLSDTGEVLGWHGTNTDVEDRRRAEEELEKVRQELAMVTQITAMGETAAAIAHEMNQPLGAIVNNSNYCLGLLGQPKADKKKRAALQDIVADANRASTIIRRICGLTNGAKHPPRALNFTDLFEEVIHLCQRSLAEQQIKVTRSVAKNLPRFRGDRVQIQQVLFNLVTNAIEAMSETEEGVLSIRVARGKLQRNPAILVTVTDNGIGFALEMAEKMFDAFYTTKKHGMGMGLRISRSIAEKYGGHLTAKRNEGDGATFSFLLPGDESVYK